MSALRALLLIQGSVIGASEGLGFAAFSQERLSDWGHYMIVTDSSVLVKSRGWPHSQFINGTCSASTNRAFICPALARAASNARSLKWIGAPRQTTNLRPHTQRKLCSIGGR